MSITQLFHAVIYGILQGITEFLPVSSTAHLTLLPKFFHWPDGGIGFDMALHLGTALAVILFFFKRWIILFKAGFTNPKSKNGKLFWVIVVSTIPASLVGVAFNDKIKPLQENPYIIGVMLILMGIVLWLVDRIGRKNVTELTEIDTKKGFFVGVSQCLAIIPGVSRSGITITAGRALGIGRETAAEFTFLLSTPIILGDAGYHLLKLHSDTAAAADLSALGGTGALLVGIIVSAIVGIISIKFLLNFLKNRNLMVFSIYRFILGSIVIVAALASVIK